MAPICAFLTSPGVAGSTLDTAAVAEAVRAPGDGYVAVDAAPGPPLAALLAF